MTILTKTTNGIEVPLSQEEIDEFNAREAAHAADMAAYKLVAYKNRRQEKYIERGVTIDAMTVALWEKFIENRPQSADSLQAIREQVKLEEPKPQ